MAKLFGLGDEDTLDATHHSYDSHSHTGHTHNLTPSTTPIEVSVEEEAVQDIDIGQIAVDILDTTDNITIVAPVAGVDPSLIDIALARNILTISGSRSQPSVYKGAKRVLVEECFYGAFSRSVILPENLAFNKVRATIEWNTLIIQIPKLVFGSQSIKIEGNGSIRTPQH